MPFNLCYHSFIPNNHQHSVAYSVVISYLLCVSLHVFIWYKQQRILILKQQVETTLQLSNGKYHNQYYSKKKKNLSPESIVNKWSWFVPLLCSFLFFLFLSVCCIDCRCFYCTSPLGQNIRHHWRECWHPVLTLIWETFGLKLHPRPPCMTSLILRLNE